MIASVAPGPLDVLASWQLAPVANVCILAAAVGYALLARQVGRWPSQRSLAWAAALFVAVVVLNGPVAVYGNVLLWVHMIGHLSLIMVVPVLAVWSKPLELLSIAVSGRTDRWGRLLVSPVSRVLTFPPLTCLAYAAVVILTHLTGFQQTAVERPTVRLLEAGLYVATGYLLFLLSRPGSDGGPAHGISTAARSSRWAA
ncbi:MAG: cytochrome c oxidase assembly protein [Pseudonocardia sp.]|uniref:cytochrome c oxidase assembly protein n=1 Tax=unclassified Pseudonocardia TaxID=2619320 RepID=UPI001AD50EB6|nr:cytochrome c oxidase assembly protein [Pseudonocardia sp.]